MIYKLGVQYSVFGDYSNIESTLETIDSLSVLIKENNFILSTIPEHDIFIPNKINKRISLVTEDSMLVINILSNRIDLYLNATSLEGLSSTDTESFTIKAPTVFKTILDVFNKSAYRLAYITNDFLLDLTEEQKDAFYKKIFNKIQYFSSKQLVEWSSMLNLRDTVKICDREEAINIIATLSTTTTFYNGLHNGLNQLPIQKTGFHITQDINTVQENTGIRFVANHVESFINETNPINSNILNELQSLEK